MACKPRSGHTGIVTAGCSSSTTSDAATSGIYLKHKGKVCPGTSAPRYHTLLAVKTHRHTDLFKASLRAEQRRVRGRRSDHSVQITDRQHRARFQRANVVITQRPWNAAAARLDDSPCPPACQPTVRRASTAWPGTALSSRRTWQQVFLSVAPSLAASEGARCRRGEERNAARSWRASGSPLATPACQPGCCHRHRACSLVCDW